MKKMSCYCCSKKVDPEDDNVIWSYICGVYRCEDCVGGVCSFCLCFVGDVINGECERCAWRGKYWEGVKKSQ